MKVCAFVLSLSPKVFYQRRSRSEPIDGAAAAVGPPPGRRRGW